MFSRFSVASRRILRAAEQECRNHNHYYVGAEHLLLALLDERDADVMRALHDEGIDFAEAHARTRRALGTGEDRLWEGILLTPRVRRIIGLAESSAGGAEVAPLHLFLALRAEGGSLAAEVLRRSQTSSTRNHAAPIE